MGENERGRDTGAGACGKRGLVPTLWRRYYRGCSRKTPQRCRLSSALQKQSIKGTALLILLWVLFPSYYDERLLEQARATESVIIARLMGKTFSLESK